MLRNNVRVEFKAKLEKYLDKLDKEEIHPWHKYTFTCTVVAKDPNGRRWR